MTPIGTTKPLPGSCDKDLLLDIAMIAEEYHHSPSPLSRRMLALSVGRAFAEQCMNAYGVRGFQYADAGVQAILALLDELPEIVRA